MNAFARTLSIASVAAATLVTSSNAIVAPRHIHNMAWGDADRQTLYLCAPDRLYRIRLNVAGAPSKAKAASGSE
jgi:hypothetical protein